MRFGLCVCVARLHFLLLFFFSSRFALGRGQLLLFTYCSSTVRAFKNIKNGFHSTIHIFKNYFATVFPVFSKNKLYPNGPIM